MPPNTNTKIRIDTKDEMSENLSKYNSHFLKVHEFAEQTYSLYKKGKLEKASLIPQQKNLIDWYTQSCEYFSYPQRKDRKVIHPPLDKLQRIREIEKQPRLC